MRHNLPKRKTFAAGVRPAPVSEAAHPGPHNLWLPCLGNVMGEGGGPAACARNLAAEAGKLHWLNAGLSLSLPFNLWMGVIGGTFVVLSSYGAEQFIVQRVLTCRTVADGRKPLILSAAVIFPLFLVFLLVGVMLWVYYQQMPMAIPIPEVRAGSGIKANDYIYPIFMMTAVPHVLKGFLIVAILAAAMSSLSSALTSLASVSTMDSVKPLIHSARTEGFFLRFSKVSTVAWAGLLLLVAYLSREVEYVLNAAFSLRGLTSGALLGALLLVLFWRKGGALPIVVGCLTSLTFMIWLSQLAWTHAGTDGATVTAKVAWPWFTLTGTFVTVGTAWLVRRGFRRRDPRVPAADIRRW